MVYNRLLSLHVDISIIAPIVHTQRIPAQYTITVIQVRIPVFAIPESHSSRTEVPWVWYTRIP